MEDDYLEHARELWRQYQFYIYIGLAMILATIAGFTYRHSAYSEVQQGVNQQLYELIKSADEQRSEDALAAYAALQQEDEFQELEYLAAFVLASLYLEEKEYQQAADILRPALDSSNDSGVRALAALRTAEALINAGDYAQAVELLSANRASGGRLQIMFEERIGDAEYAAGNIAAARKAYERALEIASNNASFYEPLLSIKHSALTSTPAAAAQSKTNAEAENAGDDSDENTEGAADNDSTDETTAEAVESADSADSAGDDSETAPADSDGSNEDDHAQ